MRLVSFEDDCCRECGIDLDSFALYVPEGTQFGGWQTRVWVHGGPPSGVLVPMAPEAFKLLLKGPND